MQRIQHADIFADQQSAVPHEQLAENGSNDCSGSNMEQPGIKLKNGLEDQGVDDLPVALFHPNTHLVLYNGDGVPWPT